MDAVELDPAVMAAATQAMGLPTARPNLRLHTADGAAFVADHVARQRAAAGAGADGGSAPAEGAEYYDIVYVDAFDGQDRTPEALCSAGESSTEMNPVRS